MSNFDLLTNGTNVRLSIYDTIDDRKQFEGEIVGEFKGKAHPFAEQANAHHANIYPSLPEDIKADTPNDYREYLWYIIALEDGSLVRLGRPWIDETSIEVVEEISAYPTIVNFKDADTKRLRQVLEQAGYQVSIIKLGTQATD